MGACAAGAGGGQHGTGHRKQEGGAGQPGGAATRGQVPTVLLLLLLSGRPSRLEASGRGRAEMLFGATPVLLPHVLQAGHLAEEAQLLGGRPLLLQVALPRLQATAALPPLAALPPMRLRRLWGVLLRRKAILWGWEGRRGLRREGRLHLHRWGACSLARVLQNDADGWQECVWAKDRRWGAAGAPE